jgi:predicted Zn-dependent protease
VDFCRDQRDQIAFVLAHEAAHIHLGHARERSQANALAAMLGTANVLIGLGLRFLLDRAFSREQEFEADRLAVRFCTRAGYAPQAAVAFLERLASVDPSTGAGPLLSTHPPLKDRVSQLRLAVAG